MTPDGSTLNQKMANSMSMYENIIILCGHYKGVDQRVRDHYILPKKFRLVIMFFLVEKLVPWFFVMLLFD